MSTYDDERLYRWQMWALLCLLVFIVTLGFAQLVALCEIRDRLPAQPSEYVVDIQDDGPHYVLTPVEPKEKP